MSAKETFEKMWKTISGDPKIIGGTVQVISALVGLLISVITRKRMPTL